MTDDILEEASYENRKQCAVQDFLARDEAPQPQDGSKFIGKSRSKQTGSLGGVSSLSSIPSILIPELDTIQYPVHENTTIVNRIRINIFLLK